MRGITSLFEGAMSLLDELKDFLDFIVNALRGLVCYNILDKK